MSCSHIRCKKTIMKTKSNLLWPYGKNVSLSILKEIVRLCRHKHNCFILHLSAWLQYMQQNETVKTYTLVDLPVDTITEGTNFIPMHDM